MSKPTVNRPCIVCGVKPEKPMLNVTKAGKSFAVVECPACGLVYSDIYLQPDTVLKDDTPYFAHDVYANEQETYLQEASRYLKAINRFKTSGKLLDIGCGFGYFSAAAVRDGWQVKGIDISPVAVEFAKRTFELQDLQLATVEDAEFAPNSFDVITMWNCIEHMANPVASIEKALTWLKPDGIIAFEAPNHDGILYSLNTVLHKVTGARISISKNLYGDVEGSHVYLFTEKSLNCLMNNYEYTPYYVERANSPATVLLSKYQYNAQFLRALASYTALYSGYTLANITRRQNRLLMVFGR